MNKEMTAPQISLRPAPKRLDQANSKVGLLATTYTESSTCPDACPMRGKGGCFTSAGFRTSIHWRKVSEHTRGFGFSEFLDRLSRIPDGSGLRHNIGGDLPGIGDSIDSDALLALSGAFARLRAFTYTHKPVLASESVSEDLAQYNRALIAEAQVGFTINLSADSLAEADAMVELNIAPVVVTVPNDRPTPGVTPAGNRVVECPTFKNESVHCDSCMLCAKKQRAYIIAFPAHGAQARKINEREES